MTPEEELQILKEIEENSVLMKKVIIVWKDDNGTCYFSDSEIEDFFSTLYEYEISKNRKHFRYNDVESVLGKINNTIKFSDNE